MNLGLALDQDVRLNGGKFVSALDSTFVNSHLKFTIVSVTFLNCEVSRNVYYKGDSINVYCMVLSINVYCIVLLYFQWGAMTKHLMIGPMGNSEFSFPSVLKVSGKQNSLFLIELCVTSLTPSQIRASEAFIK